eukprot:6490410-Amphidinium_carterae.1
MLSLQHIVSAPVLVSATEQPLADWTRLHGFPSMEKVACRVILPFWERVRDRIFQFSYILGGLVDGSETKGTEPWRRWTPGTPGSQMSTVGGIPSTSLLDGPLQRLSRPVPWQWQTFRAKVWLDELRSRIPLLDLVVSSASYTLYEYLLDHGAQSRNDRRSISTQQSVVCRRAATLLAHNHACGRGHVCATAAGIRLTCARCHVASSFAYKTAWLRQNCSERGDHVCFSFDSELVSEMAAAKSLSRAVNLLYSHLRD